MKSAPYCVAEDELQAYADGVLAPDRKATIESYLGAIPAEQQRIESYRRLNLELHRVYDRPEFASTPPCYEFLAGQLSRAVRRQRGIRRLAQGAVSLIIAIGALGALWSGHDLYRSRAQLVATSAQPAADARIVPLADRGHTAARLFAAAKPDPHVARPLTQVAGFQQKAPDLVRLGFELTGGKVVTTNDGPAVELSYQGKPHHRMTLSIKPARSVHKTAFTILEDSDASLVSWQIGGFTYSLVGDVGRQQLLELARAVSDSLQLPGMENGMIRTAPDASAHVTPLAAPVAHQSARSDESAAAPGASSTIDPVPATGAHPSGASASSDGSPGAAVQKIGLKPSS